MSHGFDRDVYLCDCGAEWWGDEAATGMTEGKPQECPQCGESIAPTAEAVD